MKKNKRSLSSVGSEHLVYTQKVAGSNPAGTTYKGFWKLWAKSLGTKADEKDNKISDKVAFIRTLLILQAVITNLLIVLNIIKNW